VEFEISKSMKYRIWIVTTGEPLPIDASEPRLLRAGVVAKMLANAGHEVSWWTANFDHQKKQKRFPGETERIVQSGLRLILLDAPPYSRNISIARVLNHRRIASAFTRRSASEARPDVILCSFPPIELAREVAVFGRRHNVPTVIDIRDLWPDVMVDLAPKRLRWLAELVLKSMRHDAARACASATAIIGLTQEYRDWGLNLARRPATARDRIFPLAYIPEPPDEDKLRAAEAYWSSNGIEPRSDSFVVAYFGVMGVHFEATPVVAAAKLLRDQGLPVKFVLCGTGDRLPRLRADCAGLNNVLLPGWVNASQIWTLMRRAKMGLAPYVDSENYRKNVPNKIVEYLSAGLPIVTNLDGAVKNLLTANDCGYFYAHDSGKELADTVAAAFKDHNRLQQRAQNANNLFEKSFSSDRVYVELIRYLEELAQAAR
jgi:glycosyltransferase involved in cell wall biosynthesis